MAKCIYRVFNKIKLHSLVLYGISFISYFSKVSHIHFNQRPSWKNSLNPKWNLSLESQVVMKAGMPINKTEFLNLIKLQPK